jgi:hypothetical protein
MHLVGITAKWCLCKQPCPKLCICLPQWIGCDANRDYADKRDDRDNKNDE